MCLTHIRPLIATQEDTIESVEFVSSASGGDEKMKWNCKAMDALIGKSGSPRALKKAGLQGSIWEGGNRTIVEEHA